MSKSMQNMRQFTDAFLLAAELHQDQKRKGSDTPYISHLMAVASIVMRFGGDDEEIIAALLHDAVEDQGGEATLGMIKSRFGSRVATIISDCSDTDQFPKPPWEDRKLAYLNHLRQADESALLVSAADKLHNALDSIMTYDEIGDKLWDLFHATREKTGWYYEQLGLIYQERMQTCPHLQPLLQQTIKAIQQFLARVDGTYSLSKDCRNEPDGVIAL